MGKCDRDFPSTQEKSVYSCVCPSEEGCVWRSGVLKTSYVSTKRRTLGLSCNSVKCAAEKLSKHEADPTRTPHLCTCVHDIPMLSGVHFQDTSVSHDLSVTNETHFRT